MLPKSALDCENSVLAELEDADKLAVTFCCPSVLFVAEKIIRDVWWFCSEIDGGQGPLLAQRLTDFSDPLQTGEGQNIYSKCVIKSTFPKKPDFSKDVLKFDGEDSTTLYMHRFKAFGQNFTVHKERFIVRTIKSDAEMPGKTPTVTCSDIINTNSAPSTNPVTRTET